MSPDELRDLELARALIAERSEQGVSAAQELREASGRSRREMVISSGGAFSIGAVRMWESGKRRPRGRAAVAFGQCLRQLLATDLEADA